MKKLILILVVLSSPAWASFSLVNTAVATNPSNSYTDVFASYNCTAGDAIVILTDSNDFNVLPADISISDTQGHTWQKAGQTPLRQDSNSNNLTWAYWTPSCKGGTTTITVNVDSASSFRHDEGSLLLEIGGFSYDHTPVVLSSFNSFNAPQQPGSITTTSTSFQIVFGYAPYCCSGGQTITSTGYSLAVANSGGPNNFYALYNASVAAGTVNPTVTQSGGSSMHAGILAFQAETYPTTGFVQDAVAFNYNGSGFSTGVAASPRFNVQTGHVMVVGVMQNSTNNTPTISSALGNTCSNVLTGALSFQLVYCCPVTVGGAETITATPATTQAGMAVEVLEYAGYGCTVNASGNSGATNTNPAVGSLTSTQAAAIVSFMSVSTSTTWPVVLCTSGLTNRSYVSSAAGGLAAYDELEAAGGSFSNSCSSVSSDGTTGLGLNYINSIFAFTVPTPANIPRRSPTMF